MSHFSKTAFRSFTPWVLGISLGLVSSAGWAQNVVIGSLVSSQVNKLYVSEGQQVKVGQKLLDLDASRYHAKLKSLQAQVGMARAKLADAQIELDQAQDLFDRTVSTRRALDAAKLAYDLAKSEVDYAESQVAMHQSWSKYLYIKSPINGKISKIHAPVGTTVFKENTPMIELAPN
ncbi:efflux RND transporter periplasmic adaptor subunit [Thiomicrorhabdus xiamenensis]|uniref:Biotin/lipoyl-binding protein n=1 Tax=Thiomicrorhabdus xiamenensis TaxID=2739063 RepID=A0A7D4P583_9GAMM|nr:biotin/lipoyl-binding protein [Thiomicrorhabdus xiamenensis]QKI89455.1 biotin/lipoyl-binding protein [Thiomicrorhabdus xiamenensis]